MIVAVAYRLPSGLIVSMPVPALHEDVVESLRELSAKLKGAKAVKGFLTDRLEFLPLPEALVHAEKAGQVEVTREGKTLHWDAAKWPVSRWIESGRPEA